MEGDLKKPSLGAICLLQSVPQIHFFKFRELSNLILEGDVEKPSLGAICLLQSVPQIDSFLFKFRELSNLILEGDVEKPVLPYILKRIIRCNLLIAVGSPKSNCPSKKTWTFDSNLISKGIYSSQMYHFGVWSRFTQKCSKRDLQKSLYRCNLLIAVGSPKFIILIMIL